MNKFACTLYYIFTFGFIFKISRLFQANLVSNDIHLFFNLLPNILLTLC